MGTMNDLAPARDFLRQQFPEGARVLCAVSGGLDSMCLLYFLDTWGPSAGFAAAAAHFNHQLRGETADRDEEFVRTWCAGRNIPCHVGRGDTRALAAEGLSVEEAARKLRYAFLEETAEREALRREYIDAHKQSLVRHLENTYVQYSDGTRRKLKRRQPPDSGKI